MEFGEKSGRTWAETLRVNKIYDFINDRILRKKSRTYAIGDQGSSPLQIGGEPRKDENGNIIIGESIKKKAPTHGTYGAFNPTEGEEVPYENERPKPYQSQEHRLGDQDENPGQKPPEEESAKDESAGKKEEASKILAGAKMEEKSKEQGGADGEGTFSFTGGILDRTSVVSEPETVESQETSSSSPSSPPNAEAPVLKKSGDDDLVEYMNEFNRKEGPALLYGDQDINNLSMDEGQSSGLAAPGLAEPSFAEPGLAEPGFAKAGLAEPGLAGPGLSEPGLAEPVVAKAGLAEPGLSEPSLSEPGLSEPAIAEAGLAEPGLSEPSLFEPGLAEPDIAEPALAKADLAEPGLSEPSLSEPGLSEPAIAEAGLAEPGLSEPSLSKPDTTESDTAKTEAGLAEPGLSEPGLAEPVFAEPAPAKAEAGLAVPGLTEPDTAEPAPAKADLSEPGLAEPDAAEPGLAEPETAEPAPAKADLSEPGLAEPDTAEPAVAKADLSEPGLAEPETAEPALAEAGFAEPGLSEPSLSEPGLAEPDTESASAKAEAGLAEPGLSEPGLAEAGPAEPSPSKPKQESALEKHLSKAYDELAELDSALEKYSFAFDSDSSRDSQFALPDVPQAGLAEPGSGLAEPGSMWENYEKTFVEPGATDLAGPGLAEGELAAPGFAEPGPAEEHTKPEPALAEPGDKNPEVEAKSDFAEPEVASLEESTAESDPTTKSEAPESELTTNVGEETAMDSGTNIEDIAARVAEASDEKEEKMIEKMYEEEIRESVADAKLMKEEQNKDAEAIATDEAKEIIISAKEETIEEKAAEEQNVSELGSNAVVDVVEEEKIVSDLGASAVFVDEEDSKSKSESAVAEKGTKDLKVKDTEETQKEAIDVDKEEKIVASLEATAQVVPQVDSKESLKKEEDSSAPRVSKKKKKKTESKVKSTAFKIGDGINYTKLIDGKFWTYNKYYGRIRTAADILELEKSKREEAARKSREEAARKPRKKEDSPKEESTVAKAESKESTEAADKTEPSKSDPQASPFEEEIDFKTELNVVQERLKRIENVVLSRDYEKVNSLLTGDQVDKAKKDGSRQPGPSFDPVEAARRFMEDGNGFYSRIHSELLDEDFVFRSPEIGPLCKRDFVHNMDLLAPYKAFPDVAPNAFGFTQDPRNPFKVWFFVRLCGKHTEDWQPNPFLPAIKATYRQVECPIETNSLTFSPDGKIKHFTVGYVADKMEGNTKGQGAAFGLYAGVGQENLINFVTSPSRVITDYIADIGVPLPRAQSKPSDIPRWYNEPRDRK